MQIDGAQIGLPLNDPQGKTWNLHECLFECFGVSKNEKEEWDRNGSAKPPSDSSLPIDEILDDEVKGSFYELAGYTHDKQWGVWRIEAQEFELNWKTKEEFKHPQFNPPSAG